MSERAFIARLEAADAEELANLLRHPTKEQEKALRAHLGEPRYKRMHELALRRGTTRALLSTRGRGNVVVIHGIMGGELSVIDRAGRAEQIWVKVLQLVAGRLQRLRLAEDGREEYNAEYDVRPTGMMKRDYGELLLSLSQNWNVRAFWFDWRKDLAVAADALAAAISGWFTEKSPVHIVAHSMGGLVARTFIKKHPRRWQEMWDRSGKGRLGGRLVMLGTPNHGSFAIPQVITGLESIVGKLALVDSRHSLADLLQVLNSFVGSYQMLPSPLVMPEVEPLYKAETYGEFKVPQAHLTNARQHHERLKDVVDPGRMLFVAGDDQPTVSNIRDFTKLRDLDAYDLTRRGDGRVPHHLAMLKHVPTYYVRESHGDLPSNPTILQVLDDLLMAGATHVLSQSPGGARGEETAHAKEHARKELETERKTDEQQLSDLLLRVRRRSVSQPADTAITPEERRAEEMITRGFLSAASLDVTPTELSNVPFEPARLEIRLLKGSIADSEAFLHSDRPIDAVAVGHYVGVKPQAAELALDQAISRCLPGKMTTGNGGALGEADLLLTQYSERGVLTGELGQPFFLADPRVRRGAMTQGPERVIAIAGMGLPGRFGVPELTVMVRELAWSLGRMGKQHLATVVIGTGNGNLSSGDAISAWIRGLKHSVTGSKEDDQRRLRRVTFVEIDGRKLRELQEAIISQMEELRRKKRLEIVYVPLSDESLRSWEAEAWKEERRYQLRELNARSTRRGKRGAKEIGPTRITLQIDRSEYRFGAITEEASIPERVIPLDPKLVKCANDELAATSDPASQLEQGQFLERLLIPDDLRPHLHTNAPLVMMLDSTTARIHWELMAQHDPGIAHSTAGQASGDDYAQYFVATSRGFTRQLRSTFAPPPEPPPPPRRLLRVLVVADPAEDAHLPGAEEEGAEVAHLFESFNRVYATSSESRVEVVRIFGPREGTRTNVLRHLMLRSYDVLHFAGHCMFDSQEPSSSGWIFTGGERLSAKELDRIDRIPRFVFSNACESGITPDRAEDRADGLAPSFAEAFFKRGVSNFVCTAWPVDDAAAQLFALTLYSGLLGLTRSQAAGYQQGRFRPMHEAMREARMAIFSSVKDNRTWGAYQHYGNPYMRFFNEDTLLRNKGQKTVESTSSNPPDRVQRRPQVRPKQRRTSRRVQS
jgi:pimeloyl-ACP methyl ester carboxylesterase